MLLIRETNQMLPNGKVIFEEETTAHELGHALGDQIFGEEFSNDTSLQEITGGYSLSDEFACEAAHEAHLRMYGDDIQKGESTWFGCSHRPLKPRP